MIETVVTTGIGTIIGAGIGGAITAKVVSAVTDAKLAELSKRVDKHDEAFMRVVYRDTCADCKKGKDERHQEVVRRLGDLESAFKACFDDLVKALRDKDQ